MDESVYEKYETVVGLEVHAQLSTLTKLFAPDPAHFGAPPNAHIGLVSLAHPGTLPVLNAKVLPFALKLALACQARINRVSYFDRKHYFYPDLPKGYQISQDRVPYCVGGAIPIRREDGSIQEIRLHHIHIEEDAGKSVHDAHSHSTLLDYNRAGVPLVEIVSQPDIRKAEDAYLFLQEIRRLVRYLGICDGNMEEGSLRCDANVSVRLKGESKLGTRVEIKNMNSLRNVRKAIVSEARRQIDLIEEGKRIIQETRTYDAQQDLTRGMRLKETLNDYRYFNEPDLPPLVIQEELIRQSQASLPRLPWEWYSHLQETYGLNDYDSRQLLDEQEIVLFFEEICKHTTHYKSVANWINGEVKSWLNTHAHDLKNFPVAASKLAELVNFIQAGHISSSAASQELFPLLLQKPQEAVEALAQAHNLVQVKDTEQMQSLIEEVLAAFPEKVQAYKKGKKGLLGMFMGELMKRSSVPLDPKLARKSLQDTLDT